MPPSITYNTTKTYNKTLGWMEWMGFGVYMMKFNPGMSKFVDLDLPSLNFII